MTVSIFAELRHAMRRSRVRVAILLALLNAHEAYGADLARVAGTQMKHVRGALYGDGDDYRRDEALISLCLVRERVSNGRVLYSLTPLGAHVTRELERDRRLELEGKPRAWT